MRIWLEDKLGSLTGKLLLACMVIVVILGGLFTYKVIVRHDAKVKAELAQQQENKIKVSQAAKDEALEEDYQLPGDAANKMIESSSKPHKAEVKPYKDEHPCPKGDIQVMQNGKLVNIKPSELKNVKWKQSGIPEVNSKKPASTIFDNGQGKNVVQEGINSQKGEPNTENMIIGCLNN